MDPVTSLALQLAKALRPVGHDKQEIDSDDQSVQRQRLTSEVLQAQARAAFELALARRVETAAEIWVEEFYDASGHGGVGVDVEAGSVGGQATGKRVMKRVVRLKGWPDAPDGELQIPTDP